MNPPRRSLDWLQPMGMIIFSVIVGYGASGLSGLKDNVSELNLKVARLETTILVGMQDRFTGEQGKALASRIKNLEDGMNKHTDRIGVLELFCSEFRGSHNGGPKR